MAKVKARPQAQIPVNAKYSGERSRLGSEGRNAPAPKVKDCSGSTGVSAKPQKQVSPGKS